MSLIEGLSVLISGGSGSLGSAICHHFAANGHPDRCIVLSRDWHKQAALRKALGDPPWMRWFIGDVRDKERLWRALEGVDYVIHAAALKDIVVCEYNPAEALAVNVLGTQALLDVAIDREVKKVLVISSDKGVWASSTYGKCKAMCESLAVGYNAYARDSGTQIAVARYGNVLGSAGSVVHAFREQAKSGRLQLTDRRMSRFWITMPNAVRFILSCLEDMRGGEVWVPVMPSMKVTQLGEAIAPDAEQVETGIRPAEKLHEILVTPEEARHSRRYSDRILIEPEHRFWYTPREDGEPLPDGWHYSSDSNDWWLTVEELRGLLEGEAV